MQLAMHRQPDRHLEWRQLRQDRFDAFDIGRNFAEHDADTQALTQHFPGGDNAAGDPAEIAVGDGQATRIEFGDQAITLAITDERGLREVGCSVGPAKGVEIAGSGVKVSGGATAAPRARSPAPSR